MKFQANYKYANTDEWVSVDGNIATIGISDFAQDQLSDVVFVEISAGIGDAVKKGATIATVESVKAASDVNAPVSGKVVAVNDALSNTPETVNSDPFGAAWLLKVELSSPAELDTLMDAAAYEKFCAERSH
ncbi:MAG: glycine cleavage system protein GcvH [Anaerolineaceae bacterium]|nr:glycine cleavage system protein GcvH [Anaerolineaceae bacterium]